MEADQTPESAAEETKRKFREALEAKRNRSAAPGSGQGGSGSIGAARSGAGSARREFRRKSG